MNILGLSAYYHDSAAALVHDGRLLAAAQEERFTRKKHDPGFPTHAAGYCLAEGGLQLDDVDYVVFYDKPILKFDRLLETYMAFAPRGFRSFVASMPIWLKDKLYLKSVLRQELADLGGLAVEELPPLMFTEHHQSHAASAFFPSPFDDAAVLCLDGVGEWATTSAWHGHGNDLDPIWELRFPHSLGLLYSAFTYFTGFKVNSGEYKLMGLAPYGEPKYANLILDELIDLKADGTFRLAMKYFNYATGLTMTNSSFDDLLGGPPRAPEAEVTQREMDIASSIQVVTEEVVTRAAEGLRRDVGARNLCLAGGVALNCVANGRLLRESGYEDIWIQPAAGDAGGAVGAALAIWHEYLDNPRTPSPDDGMAGAYLGPRYSDADVRATLDSFDAQYDRLDDAALFDELARILAAESVVGWFQGRMEFGPRALGGRSILGDPRSPSMQSVMNLRIKNRESFRPFAPSVLEDRVSTWFDLDRPSPYMLLVATVADSKRVEMSDSQQALFGIEKLNVPRSAIPATTHVDYSARVQTVSARTNPRYHRLLQRFEAETGCGVLVNTSFNVRGEPIVCTPEDAYRCFMRTEMDYLVVENYLLAKAAQPAWEEDESWREALELD